MPPKRIQDRAKHAAGDLEYARTRVGHSVPPRARGAKSPRSALTHALQRSHRGLMRATVRVSLCAPCAIWLNCEHLRV